MTFLATVWKLQELQAPGYIFLLAINNSETGGLILFCGFCDQVFLGISLAVHVLLQSQTLFNQFQKLQSVFYPHILIICIYYIPGMSSRTLKCCAIFNRMFEKGGGRLKRIYCHDFCQIDASPCSGGARRSTSPVFQPSLIHF